MSSCWTCFFSFVLKVNLSETAAQREARISEIDMELVRSRAEFAHLSQVTISSLLSSSTFVKKKTVHVGNLTS